MKQSKLQFSKKEFFVMVVNNFMTKWEKNDGNQNQKCDEKYKLEFVDIIKKII